MSRGTARRLASTLGVTVLAVVAASRSAAAQGPAGIRATSRSVVVGVIEERGAIVATTAATVVTAEPRALRVIAVPVPDHLPQGQPVAYLIVHSGTVPLVGPLSGALPSGIGRPKAVHFTVSVPARARAGALSVGSVRFELRNGEVIETPVRLVVGTRQRVEIVMQDALVAARPGEHVAVRYRLANLGNGPDSVRVDARLDTPLRRRGQAALAHSLGMREMRDGVVAVEVPPGTSPGRFTVRLTVRSAGAEPLAVGQTTVEVLATSAVDRVGGPLLTLGASTVAGPLTGTATAFTAALDGNLTDSIRVRLRASQNPDVGGAALYGLARGGFAATPVQLSLAASTWNLGLGAVGAPTSELTGMGGGGEGASLELRRPTWSASAVAAGWSRGTASAGESRMFSGRVSRTVDRFELFASAADLSEGNGTGRTLRAVAAGAIAETPWLGQLGGEVAQRQFTGGNGVGWTARADRATDATSIQLRFTHAPGGSAAFARARDDWSVGLGQRLSPSLRFEVNGWGSRDDAGPSASALNTDGGMFALHAAFSDAFSLTVNARSSRYQAGNAFGRYASDDRIVGVNLSARQGGLHAMVGGGVGELSRSTWFGDDSGLKDGGRQAQLRGSAGVSGRAGTLDLTGAFHHSDVYGALGRQGEIGVRIAEVPILSSRLLQLRAHADALHQTWFAARPAAETYRGGMAIVLPGDLRLVAEAERNPYFASAAGQRGQWFFNMRVEHSYRLPSFARRTTSGLVYRDLNGNGVREGGESGVAGVVVRDGASSAVSDADGRFILPRYAAAELRVDALSIPAGWVAASERAAVGKREFALIPMATVQVRLNVPAGDSTRVSEAELSKVAVIARSRDGRSWIGARTSATAAAFDALPPGDYALEVDLSDLNEPLRVETESERFTVRTGRMEPISVTLRPRPLRVRQLGTTSVKDRASAVGGTQ